jgi:molybdate transport system regulatory protein
LEAISKTGSISAAARSMNMSYRKAWLLVDAINKLLSKPAVTAAGGGAGGGTPVGREIIQHYHSIEMLTRVAARSELHSFHKLLRGSVPPMGRPEYAGAGSVIRYATGYGDSAVGRWCVFQLGG